MAFGYDMTKVDGVVDLVAEISDASERIAARVMAQHLPKGFEAQIREIVQKTTIIRCDRGLPCRLLDDLEGQ